MGVGTFMLCQDINILELSCCAALAVLCVIFSAVALWGRPMHRCGGKRWICERLRMLSPAGHGPGTPLLRCFSNPPQAKVPISFAARQQQGKQFCLGSCELSSDWAREKQAGVRQYFGLINGKPFVSESRPAMVAFVRWSFSLEFRLIFYIMWLFKPENNCSWSARIENTPPWKANRSVFKK